jgi:hypothetical protein
MDRLKEQEKEQLVGEMSTSDIQKHYRGTKTYNRGIKIKTITGTTTINFDDLAKKVEKFLPNTRKALKIMLAIATSGVRKNRTMLWLLFVGDPSSGKTELVELTRANPDVFSTDSITMQSFVSGERVKGKQKVHDLLNELNKKCFVVKDWTTLFTLHQDTTRKVIGDLVGIYDGSFAKFSPARGNTLYKARFSHLGCITPSTLNHHNRYLNMVGARFLFYVIPSLTKKQEDESFSAIFKDKDRNKTKRKLSKLTSRYLNKLNRLEVKDIKFNKKTRDYLTIAARFISRARGVVVIQRSSFINEDKEKITYYEPLHIQVEQPWRAIQQLMELAKYLCLVENKNKLNNEEYEIIKDITLSSMPADRATAIKVFYKREIHEITAKQLADENEASIKTSRRLLDELVFLGILDKEKGKGNMASAYSLKREFKAFVLDPYCKFMSPYNMNGEPDDKEIEKIFDL